MKQLFVFLFLLLSLKLVAQVPAARLSIKNILEESKGKWLYHPGDNPEMAQPGYDDSKWTSILPYLNLNNDTIRRSFKGICWLRFHFTADTTLTKVALALNVTQSGASEIYLDGKPLYSFGNADKDSIDYYDPDGVPYIFLLRDTGRHVLAVRYANYDAEKNYKKYRETIAGPRISLTEANRSVNKSLSDLTFVIPVFMFLLGIFFALGMLHLILYFHLRKDISNLYFSGFCLSISGYILFSMLSQVFFSVPSAQMSSNALNAASCSIAACSLSGLVNELFSKSKKRFSIFAVICAVNIVLSLIYYPYAEIGAMLLITAAAIEALVLIIAGMVRRIEGARIMGAGLMLFLILLLLIMALSTLFNGLDIRGNEIAGQIWIILAAISVLSMPLSFSVFLGSRYARINRSLQEQLGQVQLLSAKTAEQEAEKQRMLENKKAELEEEVSLRTAEVVQQKNEIEEQHIALKQAKKKSDDLLLNILPEEIAEELKEKGKSAARQYDEVSVLFTDFVDFTIMSEVLSPAALVAEIDHCFKAFDEIITRFGLEKIKTIGDAYMAVCGLPVANPGHAAATVQAAIAIRDFMDQRKTENAAAFAIRIGIHSGPVVAGIVGLKKFAYDIWGDTVNTAARMEQHGTPGKINISGATHLIVKEHFTCTYRGELEAKHKGKLNMYFAEK